MATKTRSELIVDILAIVRRVSKSKGWATIVDFDEAALQEIPASDWALIDDNARRDFIRRAIHSKRKGLLRDIEHIKINLPDGTKEGRYKQRELFDVADYRYTVAYRASRVRYEYTYMKALIEECYDRYHVQLELPLINKE